MSCTMRHNAWASLGPLLGIAATMSAPAHAKAHWDGSALIGASVPLNPGAEGLGLAPTILVAGHVAVLPLLRAGLYGQLTDFHTSHSVARKTLSGGLSLRIASPWRPSTLKVHLRTGFGVGGAWQSGISGTAFEVPLYAQVSGQLGDPPLMNPSAKPVEWTLALGVPLRFGDTGALYTRSGASAAPTSVELLGGLSFDL